jgi:hypothetical protein
MGDLKDFYKSQGQPQAAQPSYTPGKFPTAPDLNPVFFDASKLAKPGQPILAMSGDEAYQYALENYGESAFEQDDKGKFRIRADVFHSDPKFLTGGVPKKLIKQTPDRYDRNRETSYIVPEAEPQGADVLEFDRQMGMFNPYDIQNPLVETAVGGYARDAFEKRKAAGLETREWEDAKKTYLTAWAIAKRDQAVAAHYGSPSIAFSFNNPDDPKKKIIPENVSHIPGVGATVGAINAFRGSVNDSVKASNFWDVGSYLGKLAQPPGSVQVDFSAPPALVNRFAGEPRVNMNEPFEVSNFIRQSIIDEYGDEIEHMSPDQLQEIVDSKAASLNIEKAKKSMRAFSDANRAGNESAMGWRTAAGFKTLSEAREGGVGDLLSWATQSAASSGMATGAPMMASMVGSLLSPAAGRVASAAVTKSLSTNAEFMDTMAVWLAGHDIDINKPADQVMDEIVKLHDKDPKEFQKELARIVNYAHVAGLAEAGTAAVLDVGLDKAFKLAGAGKFSKEGSLLKAAMRIGNRKVFTKLLAPRALNVFEEAAKEGFEEYFTEVFVGTIKDTTAGVQAGQGLVGSFQKALRKQYESYGPDKDEKALEMAEQRDSAGAIGIYMSLFMRAATGRGNPDTALMQRARTNAAAAMQAMGGANRSVNEIVASLQQAEGRTMEQLMEFAEELALMSGHGDLDDMIARDLGLDPDTGKPLGGYTDEVEAPPPEGGNIGQQQQAMGGRVQNQPILPSGGVELPSDQPVPRPSVRNGKMTRYFKRGPDGSLVDVTFENEDWRRENPPRITY